MKKAKLLAKNQAKSRWVIEAKVELKRDGLPASSAEASGHNCWLSVNRVAS